MDSRPRIGVRGMLSIAGMTNGAVRRSARKPRKIILPMTRLPSLPTALLLSMTYRAASTILSHQGRGSETEQTGHMGNKMLADQNNWSQGAAWCPGSSWGSARSKLNCSRVARAGI